MFSISMIFVISVHLRGRYGTELPCLLHQVFQEADRRRILPLHDRGCRERQDEALRRNVELRDAEGI